jgi:WXG100 family type VII secretion target
MTTGFEGTPAQFTDAERRVTEVRVSMDQNLSTLADRIELKNDLNPLMITWHGDAKDQYEEAQRKWNDRFTALKQVLAQIAAALPQIADGYQSTDNSVKALF